jgi:PAS domain S-box-containing protein
MKGQDAAGLFRGLLEAAPDAIVIVNRRGVIELINSQTERMFGYSRDELLGQRMEILVPENLRDSHVGLRKDYMAAPFARRIGKDRTLSARRKDGTEFPAEIGISPLLTANDMLIISSIRDVTEQTRAEEVIRKLNSELEARVQERTAALRKANEKLHKEIAARHRLEKEILEISEREQQRIGRNLHDDLGQRLVGISYMSHLLAKALTAVASPEAGQAAKITGLLNNALALTRSLARGLHPVALKSGGLVAALGDLAERTSEIYRVNCRFAGPPGEPNLPDTAATHLYRIAQEAVTNAVNHGKATDIRIELVLQPERASLSVTDNGTGIPKLNPRRKGMGLRIMNYRADVINGSLVFAAPEGGGTVVTCCVPITGAPA